MTISERYAAKLGELNDELEKENEQMREALKIARGQLITLGGADCGPGCDQIQCFVLKTIEDALHG